MKRQRSIYKGYRIAKKQKAEDKHKRNGFKWFGKIPRKTYWLMSGILALLIVLVGIGNWYKTEIVLAADSQVYGPNEITGTKEEAIANLKNMIDSDNHNFVYLYEPQCELCKKLEPMIYAAAERKGVTLHRFNLHKYKDARDLRNDKGMPLINFYKELPAVAYYNKGWLMAWADGDQSEKTYDEFYEHFRFGDDDAQDHGDE